MNTLWTIKRPDGTDLGEGPFATKQAADAFLAAEVGLPGCRAVRVLSPVEIPAPAPTRRQQIESEFRIENGLIRNPGKFELQPLWVPALWDIAMEGFADSDDGETYGFTITKEDALRVEFPELNAWLGRRRTVKLVQTDQGFILAAILWTC